jgi:tRNA A-37 threonylcarbamoyl transferase component Bud32
MSATCPNCGKPVPASALQGLCPDCMLKLGAASQTGAPGRPGAGAPPPPAPPEEIARFFPQLDILECLGRGGMGVVYKARQPRLNRLVALKILAPERERDPQFAERFMREAQALARLNHPSIVTVYDFGETNGFYYLLMEFADGMSLRQLLQSRKLAPEAALAIVPPICEALQYAHDQGVVHRDIKPENVLLDKQGRVKLADFGIAKIVGASAGQPALTGAADVVGTPYYMAPEQVEKPAQVDHRADIYSLGVVLYEMLTGELPLGKFALPSRRVQVDVRLDEVVLHALEKEPDRRYQQASQVRTALEEISAGGRAAASATARGRSAALTRALLLVLAAALLAGLLLLARQRVSGARVPEGSGAAGGAGAGTPLPGSPQGWILAGSNPDDYQTALDRQVTRSGKPSAVLRNTKPQPDGFATLMQSFKADAFRNQRVRLSALVRAEQVARQAALWMRVDGQLLPDQQTAEPLAFDNMNDRPIKGTADWTRVAIVLDVPDRAQEIALGLLLTGPGQVWIDEVKLERVGEDVPVTAPPPTWRVLDAPKLDFEP